MTRYPFPKETDKALYRDAVSNDAYYGLPQPVSFCKLCVISNQRPSSTIEFKNNGTKPKTVIQFSKDEICDACRAKKQKSAIDWDERAKELKNLCDRFRKTDGGYDCLIPGSGGKDSFMQAHILKYEYGMNPLTCTWAPNIYTDWGWKNHQAWIHAGFDNILFTPNGKVHRLITRLAVENLFHPFQPFILGQKNLGPKIADLYNINLVFYGENEAEYGNPMADMSSALRNWEYFTASNEDEIYLGGASLSELRELGLKDSDWEIYLPIDPKIISKKQIEVHYLGYYKKWHPQAAYYYAIAHGNFQSSPERTIGTYSTYNSIDDKIDDFHYHTTFIKFGIGRATYDASQEIRSGDLVREEGVALVKKFDGEYPERWADEIFKYLSLPMNEFPIASKMFEEPIFNKTYYERLCDKFRSPHLWTWDRDIGWKLRHQVSNNNIDQKETDLLAWEGNQAKIQ
ncbi:N-acetyl sugar amidotransferase [Prochlorococcus marinus]|uniref:N-acetyl sugar amidotransferase n=1 Tax=Prochlorococcus marinus (strain MIT 9303) TaxID=59922 RepID=A2C5V3_PROM3|nr:N-acetyl sugar amidotransferase [Prochlorococcus marinus]ABM76863.1 Hypothetical protein P9303_01081 [Prochlorococcus marinus str. MIT 9303]